MYSFHTVTGSDTFPDDIGLQRQPRPAGYWPCPSLRAGSPSCSVAYNRAGRFSCSLSARLGTRYVIGGIDRSLAEHAGWARPPAEEELVRMLYYPAGPRLAGVLVETTSNTGVEEIYIPVTTEDMVYRCLLGQSRIILQDETTLIT